MRHKGSTITVQNTVDDLIEKYVEHGAQIKEWAGMMSSIGNPPDCLQKLEVFVQRGEIQILISLGNHRVPDLGHGPVTIDEVEDGTSLSGF